MFQLLDGVGTFVFAISGALTALHKRLDLFGVFIIAFVTALGGGTLCDVLIGKTPVGWMLNLRSVYIIVMGFFIAITFRARLDKFRISMLLFDTIGLGIFTIIGIEKGIEVGLNPIICVALGTMTASFGGVIRDILCNRIPVIFRSEIYATTCLMGGLVFFILRNFQLEDDILYVVTSLSIIITRLLAVKNNWCLPKINYTV